MATVTLIYLSLYVVALAIPPGHATETADEAGWFVPQADGTFKWISRDEWNSLAQQIQMRDTEEHKVHYYLYTDNSDGAVEIIPNNIDSLKNSKFESAVPTVIIIHGWGNNCTSDVNVLLRNAVLTRGKHNVIIFDWSSVGDNRFYTISRRNVEPIGKQLAKFIDFLNEEGGMSFSSLILMAHSLGAHVAGFAGKNVQNGRIAQIIALDPARPLFYHYNVDERLNSADAAYVESIQTTGGRLSFLRPIGTATFYPNGGITQPGCTDLAGSCSHARAFIYYAQALLENNFPAIQCDSYLQAIASQCGDTFSGISMGASTNYLNASGVYYVPVDWWED